MFLDEVGKTRNLLTADIHGSTRIEICLPANAWASAPRWTFSLQVRLENAPIGRMELLFRLVRFPNEPGEKRWPEALMRLNLRNRIRVNP
jgi:hypothetical protein